VSNVLAVVEQRDGALRKVSHEVVTGARRLADGLGGTVEALVLGAGAVRGTDALGSFGADTVVTATNSAFARYAPEGFAQAVAERAKAGGFGALVVAARATGKGLAPRVAAKLGVALAADATDVGVEGGRVVVTRPIYAGKALLKVKLTTQPAVVSLRPNVFTPLQRPKAGAAQTVSVSAPAGRVVVKEIKAAEAGALDVAEAPIVIYVPGDPSLLKPGAAVTVSALKKPDGTPSLFAITQGLAAFGIMEIEVRGYLGQMQPLYTTLLNIADYLIKSNAVLKDGDTLGSDMKKAISVKSQISTLLQNKKVYLLIFEQ